MGDQQKHQAVGHRLSVVALVIFAVILAYLLWPPEPFASATGKLSAVLAVVLVLGAIALAAAIW
jgi:predicted membrane protein